MLRRRWSRRVYNEGMTQYPLQNNQQNHSLAEQVREAKAKRQAVLRAVSMRRTLARRGRGMQKQYANMYRLTDQPLLLRRRGLQLDNVALVPASLLPLKSEWQKQANELPQGT